MIVRVLPADMHGCGYYRCVLPVNAAKAAGHDVGFAAEAGEPDVVVLQRPMHRNVVEHSIPTYQARGIRVVVEIDDNFAALPASNPAFYTTSPTAFPENNRLWLKRACGLADRVTCTTPALAEEYGRGKASVIPNYVPRANTDIENVGQGRVGFAGALVWHAYDLETIRGRIHDVPFLTIGDETTLPYCPDGAEVHPYQPISQYPHALAKLSIGLVPLADNAFNRSKSALKATEYAAVGVFPLMSPSPANVWLHETYGIGELVTKPKHWNRAIHWWLEHSEERERRAKLARETVREELTIESKVSEWIAAWELARA